jgi:hypothetical protein
MTALAEKDALAMGRAMAEKDAAAHAQVKQAKLKALQVEGLAVAAAAESCEASPRVTFDAEGFRVDSSSPRATRGTWQPTDGPLGRCKSILTSLMKRKDAKERLAAINYSTSSPMCLNDVEQKLKNGAYLAEDGAVADLFAFDVRRVMENAKGAEDKHADAAAAARACAVAFEKAFAASGLATDKEAALQAEEAEEAASMESSSTRKRRRAHE